MNYATYPFKYMRITQNYDNGNHRLHSHGSPKDYPIDEAGKGSGRNYMYCPVDEMRIVKLYGNEKVGLHCWLQSTAKVSFIDGTKNYLCIMIAHLDADDYNKLFVGKLFKRGDKMFREGSSGNASGNHLHIACGKGSLKYSCWTQNNFGVWVINASVPVKPEKVFWVDENFTKILSSKDIVFQKIKPDVYTLKNGEIIVGKCNSLEEARKLREQNNPVKIYNSKGEEIK